ncbi:hypothetical protein L7F22_018507 [Adiantum nelumboides]|nr:hypothetical protein [Adiantum nelumboides]
MSSLCEFKRDMQRLPRQVLLQKLVECYKELINNSGRSGSEFDVIMDVAKSRNRNSRRLLKELNTQNDEAKETKAINPGHEAPFHLDYSGPQTHPPKNN